MPLWVLYYEYAKEFGVCHPQDVPKVVTVQAWYRWRIWKKTQEAREIHEAFKTPGAMANFSPEQKRLLSWPMGGEY